MKETLHGATCLCWASALLIAGMQAGAARAAELTAADLGATLTPFGAEKAASADAGIPAWTGGMTSDPEYKPGGRRDHLFAGDAPEFTITSQNLNQYADQLSEATKAMFAAYPDTYKMNVYKTVRSAAAPQWVYDNTRKNAQTGKLVEGPAGPMPVNVFGGIPFPLAKSGAEAIWNHQLTWRGESWDFYFDAFLMTADGNRVLLSRNAGEIEEPYYYHDSDEKKFTDPAGNNGVWQMNLIRTEGPPIRAGEQILQYVAVNSENDAAWIYLTGQRRVRKLPNSCCDAPHPATAGIMTFDEIFGFYGRMNHFDWKLIGKKDLYVPYNNNMMLKPKAKDLLGPHHLNPDYVRWEKHRVWVVEATLKPGMRHVAPRGVYYLDEDTWNILQVDRYDANGRLWKSIWQLPFVAAEQPVIVTQTFGFYDLNSKTWYIAGVYNDFDKQYPFMKRRPRAEFTAESMTGEGVR